ncbi:class I SAM-dependent methyltransferase [Aliivibrio fischeri]|uniref:class I SAM-dependent methyltransferase n=1 Tax=Aliivibrio fischeri TaxID=668 RepID=UPI00080E3E79|nr:class I SAM-dependent methyltransferase [Aliivibrio fischeri]MUH95263.1 methyltransferase domain-containing protein [Aliivibrio fischeri]MUI65491.1 methyltransferase domain-containing protein [Aliivibrio fischeri]MUJ19784.1 methyltransferase domain-containing protein [Aliivibrio fischeri]MUJ23028.1 methyltransferase domain-containing protein [Aliivibrio fischeri]OCH10063.1 methyltransferase [Aliivibrio fischeri]
MKIEALDTLFTHLEEQLNNPPSELRRLFHGRGQCFEGLEQITVDWLQAKDSTGQLVVALFKEQTPEFVEQLVVKLNKLAETSLWKVANGTSILLQHRYQEFAPTQVVWGEENTFPVVEESNLKYQLELKKNQNMGIFLDMRYGRKWVQTHSEGKSVLNLFAYTCGFSVAAIAGGATQVVNLDMAKASLGRGRDNHRLNQHDLSKVKFLGHDIFKSWGKIKKLGLYDLIIIDPPSFQKGSFALTKDYQKILRRLPSLLTETGEVLACVNSPAVSTDFLIDGMAEEAPELKFVERLDNPPEFSDISPESGLKVMRFTR